MPETIFSFVLTFAVLAILFGALDFMILFLIRKNVKWPIIITAGIMYFAVIFFGFYMLTKQAADQDVTRYISAELTNSLDVIVAQQKKLGMTDTDIQELRKNYDLFVIKTFPAWSFISVVFMVFLNYLVVRLFAFRKYGIKNEIKSFELWYLNESVIYALIAGIALMLLKNKLPADWMYIAALNIVFVLLNVYFFTGMGILSFLLKKFKAPPFLQIIAYMGVIFFMQLTIAVVLAGILDTWFNFRKIEKGGSIWR